MLPTAQAGNRRRIYAINRFVGPVPFIWSAAGFHSTVAPRACAEPRFQSAWFGAGIPHRSSGYLWAIVSNGLLMRVLRDNQSLSRQSFLEFDLEAMFSGEVYSDFVCYGSWSMHPFARRKAIGRTLLAGTMDEVGRGARHRAWEICAAGGESVADSR